MERFKRRGINSKNIAGSENKGLRWVWVLNFICLFILGVSLFFFRLCFGWFLPILRQGKEEQPRNPSSSLGTAIPLSCFFNFLPFRFSFFISLSHTSFSSTRNNDHGPSLRFCFNPVMLPNSFMHARPLSLRMHAFPLESFYWFPLIFPYIFHITTPWSSFYIFLSILHHVF